MKTLKYSFGILLSFLAIATFSSCEEEVEYTPAAPVAGEQVAFEQSSSAQIDITPDTKSFDIPVTRANAGAAVSVPVTVTADSIAHSIFEFPATIEFADSADAATYTVTVKEGAVIEYAVYHSITLDIEESMTSPYVKGSYTFAVGAPEPWSEWEKVGTGTFTLAGYWSGTHSELPIYYREYMLNDVDAEFFIPGVADAMDLTIDYNRQTGDCQVDVQHVLDNATYGPVYVCDYPHYPLQPGLTYENYPCHYNAETGLFTLNLIYFVSTDLGSAANGYFGMGTETFQLDGFEVPVAPDYSFSMEFRGHYIDNAGTDNAVIAATKGADVAQFLMTVISADDNAQATVTGMLKGEVACDTLTESGFYAYPMNASGNFKALAITFDAEGNPLEAFTKDFEFYMAGQENPWVSLGMATYTEDCLTTFFDVPNETYPVEVRQNKDNPGLYRIIHPYAAYGADTSKEYFIEIDATDPEGVYIPNVYGTGLDAGKGEVSITSMAYYYMATQGASLEDVKDAGYCGIFADNVITFPAKVLMISMSGYNDGAWYKSNANGAFKLDMSNMTPVEAAAAKAPAMRNYVERELKNVEGGIKFGIRAKKIDSSCLPICGVEVK